MEPNQPSHSEAPGQSISQEVTFSLEGKPASIRVNQVNDLFSDIRKFNNQFSMRAMIAKLLTSNLRTPEDQPSSGLNQVGQETQMLTASGVNLVHESTLDKLGLDLEPVEGKNARLFTRGQKVGEGEMRVNIKDRGKFLGFLHALDPQQVEKTELRENLHSLSNILAQQIYDQYDLQQPSDEALQLFGSLESITQEYKRLGIGGIERLETYLNHAKHGDLREWILIEHQNLLSNPGESFGPADWQEDSSFERLKSRWDRALAVLRMTQENPKAQDLYGQLFSNLARSAKIALVDLKNLDYWPEGQKAEIEKYMQGINQTFENPPQSPPQPNPTP
ncbi:MAG: hypothetical protein A2687_05415 [Candidatus Levybacteria bacterium RIFCSPHIGHO2_01_FULL_38_26]|nr:MAG: hypothetical protein A2687_05415 [Candidatus Levybacteria bacterium RIFCSPHIGHO2_01_FULL_38_26]